MRIVFLPRILFPLTVFVLVFPSLQPDALGAGKKKGASKGDEVVMINWKCDDPSPVKQAKDATPANKDGTITGRITGGIPGISGTAFSGFTSETSTISRDIGQQWPDRFAFQLWLRNPGNAAVNVIAVGGSTQNASRLWQLQVSGPDANGQRTMTLIWQLHTGQCQTFTSDPFKWEKNTWHHLALSRFNVFIRCKEPGQKKEFGERGAGFRVWLTPAGADEVKFLFGGTTSRAPVELNDKDAQLFTVGASRPGPHKEQPGGCFGGDIDEISLQLGRALYEAHLNPALFP